MIADELRAAVADLHGLLKHRLLVEQKPGDISIVLPREAFFRLLDELTPAAFTEAHRAEFQLFPRAYGVFIDPLSGLRISIEWSVPR